MKILQYILLVCLAAQFNTSLMHAQDDINPDSIKAHLQTLEGEDHFRLLMELSRNVNLEADVREGYAEDAVDFAEDLDRVEFVAEAYLNLGDLYNNLRKNEEAVRALQSAYNASEENNYKDGMADALARIGRSYVFMSEEKNAMDNLIRAREMAKEAKNLKVEAMSLYWMGDMQRKLNDLALSSEHFEEALPIAREAEDRELEADILSEIGLLYYLQGDFNMAIENYSMAAPLYAALDDKFSEARTYLRIANSNFTLARYDVALTNYQEALPIFEDIGSAPGVSAVLNGMALIYFSQNFYEKALEIHFQRLELSREIGDQFEIGNALNNIGVTYDRIGIDSMERVFGSEFHDTVRIKPSDAYLEIFQNALDYYHEALDVREKMDDRIGIAGTVYNLGITYINSGKPDEALQYLERALTLNEELNNRSEIANIYLRLGQVYLAFENYSLASRYLNQSLNLALELDLKQSLEDIYLNLSDLYSKLRNFEQALIYYRQYSAVRDTLNTSEKMDQISEMQVKYETEATEKENALLEAKSEIADAKLKQTRIILTITIIAIGIFLAMVVQLIRQNNLKKKANRELAESNALITEQKKEITDSIQYASRIQNAMLPPGDYVDKLLPDRFIIFMPRDIVSGDYYYITEKDDKVICVAADCTGHGVPGAFMSMLGIAFLNEIISKQAELHTDEMLGELRSHIVKNLHQTGKEGESQDGMDLALYIADLKNMKLEFSGANNSLILFRNGEMIEAKADKMPIGIHTRIEEDFTRHNLDLQKGDMIYTFSDGYPDQFGGPNQKKFMIKKFKKMLNDINQKSMEEQKSVMENTLAEWMSETEQVDDILVIGVRV
jgi:serine phosphatase RsbU (regulator of sigma subunit)